MKWISMCCALAIALAAAGCVTNDRIASIEVLSGDSAAGKGVYEAHCSSCHGPTGAGTDSGPDIRGHLAQPAAWMLSVVLDGAGDMPAFDADVSDQQAADLLSYLDSLK